MDSKKHDDAFDASHSHEYKKPLMSREGWGEDEVDQVQRRPARIGIVRKFCSAIFLLRYILDTVLLITTLGYLIVPRYHDQGQLETSGDITGFAPTSK